MNLQIKNKYKLLALSLVLDAIGFIPFIDIIWAPISGYLMTKMYKGDMGKLAGIFTFFEELLPGTDIIPTFTLMWLYTYIIKAKTKETVIEVD